MAKKTRGYTTTRDVYKAVKKYDHRDFDEFCTKVYMNGYKDGQMAPKAKPEASADIETVMKAIKDVKGVGPALAEKIKKAILGTLEEGGEKKDVRSRRNYGCPIMNGNKQEEYNLIDKEVEKFCQEGCSVDCDIF